MKRIFVSLLLLAITVSIIDAQIVEINGINFSISTYDRTASVSESKNCEGDITIPRSVNNNGKTYVVERISDHAFDNCTKLISISLPNSINYIGKSAFESCTNLIKVDLPTSLRYISPRSFWGCEKLAQINIPSNVTSIGGLAFCGCIGLKTLNIPRSVSNIEEMAFSSCVGLESIMVEEGNDKYDSRNNCNAIIETNTNTIIQGCKATVIPSDIINIGTQAFSGITELHSIRIPEAVISIGDGAFSGSGIDSLIIPGSVSKIGKYAFQQCNNLKSITIPHNVTFIDDVAFSACDNLKTIILLGSDFFIGDGAFCHNKNLKDVYCYSQSVPQTGGDDIFGFCSKEAVLHVPQVSINSYSKAFAWKREFKDIVSIENNGKSSPMKYVLISLGIAILLLLFYKLKK